MSPKRLALFALIGSVALSALLGVWALLVGEFGDVEAKILLTSLSISAASILSMASAVAWEQRKLGPLPHLGIVLALVACAGFVLAIWLEMENEAFWKTVASLGLASIAVAHACLLSLARLAPAFRWSFLAGVACAFVTAVSLIVMLWTEAFDSEWWWRWTGVGAILLAAFTVAVPILHRLSRLPREEATAAAGAPRVRACPLCGATLDAPFGGIECASCGGRCRVEDVA